MKPITATFALIALLAGGLAAAQTPPPPDQSPPPAPSQDPNYTSPPPDSQPMPSTGASGSTGTADKKELMKSCIAQERASHPQLSKHEAKKVCEDQLKPSPQ